MREDEFNRALLVQRDYVRRCMEAVGTDKPTHLARRAGINPSMLNRIMNSARQPNALLGRKSLSALFNATGLLPPEYEQTRPGDLASTDDAMARVAEDLITTLLKKKIIQPDDLPTHAIELIHYRRHLRRITRA